MEVVYWAVAMAVVVEYSSGPSYGLVDMVNIVEVMVMVVVVQSSVPPSSWLENKLLVSQTCYYSQLFPLQMFLRLGDLYLEGNPMLTTGNFSQFKQFHNTNPLKSMCR